MVGGVGWGGAGANYFQIVVKKRAFRGRRFTKFGNARLTISHQREDCDTAAETVLTLV